MISTERLTYLALDVADLTKRVDTRALVGRDKPLGSREPGRSSTGGR